MGSDRVTIANLEVVKVDAEHNLLLIKGALPGSRGTMLTIKETVKN
jgi:large subunit ribosomal protein L3